MADVKKLLEIRKKMSKRRPKFLRQDYHHRLKVQDDYWRAPKGRHSKMKQRKRSHRAVVAVGYRGPAEVRNLYKTGAAFVRVENLHQLLTIDPKKSVVILSSKVGAIKRYELLKKAIEKNISIVNIDAKKFIADFDAKQKAKKEAKTAKKAKTEEKKEEKKVEAPKVVKTTAKPAVKAEVKPKEITLSSEHKVAKTQEDKFGA